MAKLVIDALSELKLLKRPSEQEEPISTSSGRMKVRLQVGNLLEALEQEVERRGDQPASQVMTPQHQPGGMIHSQPPTR